MAEYPGTTIIVEPASTNDHSTVTNHLPYFHNRSSVVVSHESKLHLTNEQKKKKKKEQKGELWRVVDLVITIGGDGTILHLSSLFDTPSAILREACKLSHPENAPNTSLPARFPLVPPPIISFSMGTLGFLMPFNILALVS